ncbi:prepilin peptidase [Pseudomonas sp. MOB-449]|nr:prepilin peptidase [Pseudomonas sp. MOB-449]
MSEAPLMILSLLIFVAVINDLRARRIPNLLIITGIALGLVGNAYISGIEGVWQGSFGLLIGFSIFLPLYVLGGMAAGDVKLMAMVGSFLSPQYALISALYSLVAGGACGLLLVLAKRQVRQTLGRYWLILKTLTYVNPQPDEVAGKPFPYSIAILFGFLASHLWNPFSQ